MRINLCPAGGLRLAPKPGAARKTWLFSRTGVFMRSLCDCSLSASRIYLSARIFGDTVQPEDLALISNRNRQRRDCTISKPVTPSILRQQRSAERLRRFDWAIICGYGVLVSVLLLRLAFGDAFALPKVAQVGDQLHYAPHFASVTAPVTAVPANLVTGLWSPPGRSCVLDVPTMMQPGGTVSVLAVRDDGVMLSWAGGATAPGVQDCRGGQNVLVSDQGYRRLAMAHAPVGGP
jgi:hypothetical protein